MNHRRRSLALLAVAVPLASPPATSQDRSAQTQAAAAGSVAVFGQPTRGHLQPVTGVDYAPDGKTALSCSLDGTIQLYRVRDGARVRTLRGHTAGVWAAYFSADGAQVVSLGADRTVRFFDAQSGEELGRIDGLSEKFAGRMLTRIESAMGPGRKVLHVVDLGVRPSDRLLRFDLATRKQLDPLVVGGNLHIRHFVFSRDGKHLVLAQLKDMFKGQVSLFDCAKKKVVYTLDSQRGNRVALLPDGERFLLVGSKAFEFRKLADGAVTGSLRGIADTATGCALSADGSRLALGFFLDTVLLCIDLKASKLAFQYGEFHGSVNALALAPARPTGAPGLLLAGSADGTVRFLDGRTGAEAFQPRGHQNRVQAVAVSADGAQVVSGAYDNEVVLWDGETREVRHEAFAHEYAVIAAGFTDDGKPATASNDNTVKVFDAASGKVVRTIGDMGEETGSMTACAFRGDGLRVVTGHGDGAVFAWDLKTGKQVLRLLHEGAVTALAIAGPTLAVGTGGSCQLHTEGGEAGGPRFTPLAPDKKRYEDEDDVAVVALALVGEDLLVMGHANGLLRLFSRRGGAPIHSVDLRKDGGITALQASVDGKRLFVGTPSGLRVLNPKDLKPLRAPIQVFDAAVYALAASADGRHLFAGMTDGTLIRLDLGKWK